MVSPNQQATRDDYTQMSLINIPLQLVRIDLAPIT
jgi:hypothetical protein